MKKRCTTSSITSGIDHIAVLIPARDEEQLLPRCIASIVEARSMLPSDITCDIIVAVDQSTDRTLQIARSMLKGMGTAIVVNAGVVGMARACAAKVALDRYPGDKSRCWLANTDADCVVPISWLVDQVASAQTGAHAVAGIVGVDDFSEHEVDVSRRFTERYTIHPDGTHPHVHGANIGTRADIYLQAGGWTPLATAEDHDLWNRLSHFGCKRVSIAKIKVLTSGRRMGRAPDGFAQALALHNEVIA